MWNFLFQKKRFVFIAIFIIVLLGGFYYGIEYLRDGGSDETIASNENAPVAHSPFPADEMIEVAILYQEEGGYVSISSLDIFLNQVNTPQEVYDWNFQTSSAYVAAHHTIPGPIFYFSIIRKFGDEYLLNFYYYDNYVRSPYYEVRYKGEKYLELAHGATWALGIHRSK